MANRPADKLLRWTIGSTESGGQASDIGLSPLLWLLHPRITLSQQDMTALTQDQDRTMGKLKAYLGYRAHLRLARQPSKTLSQRETEQEAVKKVGSRHEV